MRKTLTMAIATLTCATAGGAEQEDIHTLSGEIRLLEKSKAPIYIYLVDEEAFKIPLHGLQELVVHVDAAAIERGRVFFRFDGLPLGRYGIRCFHDLDRDRKLGRGMFGPTEPWGMSWQRKGLLAIPRFNDIAFQLDGDRNKLVIHLE